MLRYRGSIVECLHLPSKVGRFAIRLYEDIYLQFAASLEFEGSSYRSVWYYSLFGSKNRSYMFISEDPFPSPSPMNKRKIKRMYQSVPQSLPNNMIVNWPTLLPPDTTSTVSFRRSATHSAPPLRPAVHPSCVVPLLCNAFPHPLFPSCQWSALVPPRDH